MFSIGEKVRVRYKCVVENCQQCIGLHGAIATVTGISSHSYTMAYDILLEDGRKYVFYSGDIEKIKERTYESGF